MKIIIGLGNPEKRYETTRHNVGFRFLEGYASENGLSFQIKDKFQAYIAESTINDTKVLLVKPSTYYNESGVAARLIADFYKVEARDILIIHDELALPFKTIRTRYGGSDAGNNGVKSLNTHLGNVTARIRVGVYNELRDKVDDAQFVLSSFSKQESEQLDALSPKIYELIDAFIDNSFPITTH